MFQNIDIPSVKKKNLLNDDYKYTVINTNQGKNYTNIPYDSLSKMELILRRILWLGDSVPCAQ